MGPHECENLLQEMVALIESKESLLRHDESLYDADTLLDWQQLKHTVQVLSRFFQFFCQHTLLHVCGLNLLHCTLRCLRVCGEQSLPSLF